ARTCNMHVPWVLCMRTVASISATGISQKSLIDHGLHSFWSYVVRVVRVAVAELSPTSYPGLGVASSGLFRGGVSASRIPALRLVDGVDREIDSSPDVNKNLTPMCHRNLTKEWEHVSSMSLSIGKVIKNLSKKQPSSSVEAPIVVECVEDPFKELDDILGDYAHTGKQITRNEITRKQMVVHVEVEVDADNESEEESDTEGDYTSDPKRDISIGAIEVQKDDLDVIDYESFGSDLEHAHVYSIKVNPCNGREMWPVVEATTVIVPPLYKPRVGRPPKKRKKSHDEIANESFSSGKLSKKGKSVRCGKCGNVGHNRKGCKGQGGATQGGSSARNVSGQGGARRIIGARNVSGQASARQAAGAKTVSGQAGGASNVLSQSGGSSQPIAAQSTSTGAKNAIASQGPTQHSVGPRQGFQAPRSGFLTQRLTKAIASRHNPRKFSS
nr:hypothetical protein [Tanacetum cinerariifolium]